MLIVSILCSLVIDPIYWNMRHTVLTRANIDRKCVLLVLQAPVPWIFSKSSLAN